jgi:hypothetical protein
VSRSQLLSAYIFFRYYLVSVVSCIPRARVPAPRIHFLATHPCVRLRLSHDTTLLQSLKDAKDELYTEYTTHYAQSLSPASSDDTVASTTTTPTSPPKFDFLGRYKWSNVSTTSQLKCELDKYFEMTAEPEDMKTCDFLKWWKNQESTFPNLYKLARDIHCIPGTLAKSPPTV